MNEPWPDDVLAVACMRSSNTDRIVPGSLVKTCSQCEASIWVSPATLTHIRDKPHRLVCMECMLEMAAQDDDPRMAPVTDEQLEEIKQTLDAEGLPPPTDEQLRQMKEQIEREGILPTARKILRKGRSN